jgi:hypothetical protein
VSHSGPPAGYRESALGGTLLVAREDCHDAARAVLAQRDTEVQGSLHRWAAAQRGARPMQGRGVAWAARFGPVNAVIRHSRHGGALASLTGDLFLAPSRAPRELATALRLRGAGVATPEVLAYAVYSVAGPLCRADVVTAEIDGTDLPGAWADARGPAAREGIVDSVAVLLRAMRAAGAFHPDLNVKNVLISSVGGALLAYLLDVDRVQFHPAASERAALMNAMRLRVSLSKWRRLHGLDFGEANWARLVENSGIAATPARTWR